MTSTRTPLAPFDLAAARGLEAEGFTVLSTTDLQERKVFRGFTPAAQAALALSVFGASTYKAFSLPLELPDFDALLLSRAAVDPDTDGPAHWRALGLI